MVHINDMLGVMILIWLVICLLLSIVAIEEGINFFLRRKLFERTRDYKSLLRRILEGLGAVMRLKRQKKKTKASA